MKKSIIKILTLFVLIIASILMMSVPQTLLIQAETAGEGTASEDILTDEEKKEQIYQDLQKGGYELQMNTDILDSRLYSALLQKVKDYIQTKYDYTYNSSTIYNTMFKYIVNIDMDNMGISDLTGLEKIDFGVLETLKITNNSIENINSDIFKYMPNLKTINFSNNNLQSIAFEKVSLVTNVNLSTNKLTQIDLSMLSSGDLDINLANNNFVKMSDIKIPTRLNSIKLNVINNNIVDISNEYYDFEKLTLNVGLQGIKSDAQNLDIDTSVKLKYYKTLIPNVSIKIFKVNNLTDEQVLLVSDESITEGNYTEISLPVGNYFYEYYIEDSPAYREGDSIFSSYKTYRFCVRPSECTIKYEFKGKVYDTFENKVTGKVKVMLACEDGGETYYQLNGGEWTKGNEIMCGDGGNYSINVKVIKDGYESEVTNLLIKTSLNTIIPDVLMLILVLLFSLTLFLVVMPLVSKKWFKK